MGAVFQAAGDILGGQAGSQAANAQSQIARNNAIIADMNARDTLAAGDVAETAQQLKNRAIRGSTKAIQGANGLDVNSGSAVDVQQSEAKLGALDALTIRSNAAREAYGYTNQAEDQRAQSKIYRQQAKAAQIAGFINASATLLGAASSSGDKYVAMKNSGGGGGAAGEPGGLESFANATFGF